MTRLAVGALIIATLAGPIFCITCSDVEEKGSGALFTVEELKTLTDMDASSIKPCLALLGKEPMSSNQSSAVWNALLEIYGSGIDIPEEHLKLLGSITSGIPPAHFSNLSFTEIDTISAFGKRKDLSYDQVLSLKEAVAEQWRGKDMEDLTNYDLEALRQILCVYNATSILSIHPMAYKEAAHELSTLTNCSAEVIKALATLATSPIAFGDPTTWTPIQITSIGCIIAGLPSIHAIPSDAIEGLTSQVINCLPPEVFQEMSEEQISRLTPAAAGSISSKQMSGMSAGQKYAVKLAVAGTAVRNRGNGLSLGFHLWGTIFCCGLALLYIIFI